MCSKKQNHKKSPRDQEEPVKKEFTPSSNNETTSSPQTKTSALHPLEVQCVNADEYPVQVSQEPSTPSVHEKWRVAARRSLGQDLLAEEGDEPEIEPEMPIHGESLSKGKGRVIERRETLFLNEGDSHNVWKGQRREQGPLLADVALVALRKKREKDLRKRQHSLYSRIAATQVALKDQTEELLGGQEEEENENVDETGEKEKTHVTFKQASAMVRNDIRCQRKSKKPAFSLTDMVNQLMKDKESGAPQSAFSQLAQHRSLLLSRKVTDPSLSVAV